MTNKEITLAAKLFHQSYYNGDTEDMRRDKAIRALHAAQIFYKEANQQRKRTSWIKRLIALFR